jgi:hypothetical protein
MSRDSQKAKMTCANASAGFGGDREERESVSETHHLTVKASASAMSPVVP